MRSRCEIPTPSRRADNLAGKPERRNASWDPEQYLKFANHRLRPALDLMGRIPLIAVRR